MKLTLKLTIYSIKAFFRDRQALFWTILFPMMFVVIFGLFNFEKMGTSQIAIIDKAKSNESSRFIEELKKIEILKINQDIQDEEEANEKLKKGDLDFVLIIPASFRKPEGENQIDIEKIPEGIHIPIKVYYDEENTQLNPLVLGVLDQFVTYTNLQASGAPSLFSIDKKPVESKNIGYLDILVPGIIAMAIMFSAVTGLAVDIAESKERKILKRLFVTPLKVSQFLIAKVSSFLTVAFIQVLLLLLVSILIFKVKILGSYFLIYLFALIGCILFLNIGFIIAGFVKTSKAAEALAMFVTIPMMFFSGTFFPKEIMPKILAKVVDYLPLTPLIDALRKISIDGAGLLDLKREILFLGAWILVSAILAIKLFRFKEE